MIVSRSTSCPYCGDDHYNSCYIIYDDGDHCYACGKGTSNEPNKYIFRPDNLELTKSSQDLYMPKYTLKSHEFSMLCLAWLYKYYVYDELIVKYYIAYCGSGNGMPTDIEDSLLFPILNSNGSLVEYQRRYFPSKKFFSTSGLSKEIFVATKSSVLSYKTLILVEDYISAIRVGENCDCLCLFGTSINSTTVNFILTHYSEVLLWFDNDNAGKNASFKISEKLYSEAIKFFGDKAFCVEYEFTIQAIHTDLQPKEYTNTEIKTILGEYIV